MAVVNKVVSVSTAIAIALAPTLTQAQQLPTGGSVAAGSASISVPNSKTLNVNQSSDRAVINWNSFSVGQGGTVNFNQPGSSSATLNRVTGSTPSSIAGTINAPGTVLLVNPNGIAITSSGVVNVGSFAASTLDIKNSDFMSGNYKFSGNGASAGVTNAGRINVSDGGFAALLGGQVANDGVISARLGRVGLGSGELITLDLSGDGFLSVAVPTSSLGGIVGSNGKALVSNKGRIVADGGIVYLSAATTAGLLRDAVNVPGSIRANSVGTSNGKIVIGGGAGGKVRIAGKLKANGGTAAKGGSISVSGAQVAVSGKISAKGATGGTIKLTGGESVEVSGTVQATGTSGSGGVVVVTADQVTLGDTAKLDASGVTGGTLLIGGDYQGGNGATKFSIEPIQNALTTTVAAGATLSVNGTAGNGGKIVVWSDNLTTFAGAISATGAGTGQNSGSIGGFAEVSGHRLLDFTGTANLNGPGGFGTLLLDPRNVVISSSADLGGAIASGTYTPSADDSILNVSTLQTALGSGNVIVTTGSTGSQSGDITVANAVTWTSGNSLTLTAANNIAINAAITATNGGLTINAVGAVSAIGAINVANFTLASGAWSQNTASLPAFAATNFTISGGSFLRVTGGNGSSGTPYQVADVFGLQGIGSSSAYLSAYWQIANDIDASGTANWNSGAGFAPIGTFSGSFNGLNHTISGLTINRSGDVGLFSTVSNASGSTTLSNFTLAGGSVVGTGSAGAVAAQIAIGTYAVTVENVTSSVNVQTTGNYAGGLIGQISGSPTHYISNSSSSGNVSGALRVGGLVGSVMSTIFDTDHATGTVTSTGGFAGGLVGVLGIANNSSIWVWNSYATGAVNGVTAGGLAGKFNSSTTYGLIADSYASGVVTGTSIAGGLIGTFGYNTGSTNTLNSTYATGSVTAPTAGGLVGDVGAYSVITASYATGAVNGSTSAGGLVGQDAGSITNSYASGAVSGTGTLGGLIGINTGTVGSNVYWDTGTTTKSAGYGTNSGTFSAVGLTTAQARTQSSYSGWDFASTWYMVDGQTRPFLRSEYSTTITNAHQLQLIGMNTTTLASSYTLANNINLGAALSNASDMWGSAGWVPIGKAGGEFNGTFDGGYHIVSGLTINRPTTDYVGLFGATWTANISRVGLTNVNIVGQNLVGALGGNISGSVSDAFATGTVSGGWEVGGLIGETDDFAATGAQNTRLYANVAVNASGGQGGGLIGQNNIALSQAYATGRMTGVAGVAGLVGYGTAAVTNGYYDSQTSGSVSGGGTGRTTAQLQAALATGFDSNWGIITGQSYAYLKGFYASGAPQAISGTAYTDFAVTAAVGAKVSALSNGTAIGSTYAGANGYYYMLLDAGVIGGGSQVAVYTTGANAGVTYQQDVFASLNGFNIAGGWLYEAGAATSLSSMTAGLATAIGSSGVSTALANRFIASTGASFTLDQAVTQTGFLQMSAAGNVTQNSGASLNVSVLKLNTATSGSNFSLLDTGNVISTLANTNLGTGSLSLYDSVSLTVSGIAMANGGLLIQTAGSLTLGSSATISSSASGNAIVLVAGTTFINSKGASALSAPNGRFLVYSQDPANDNIGGLIGGKIYSSTYAANPPASISATGNQFIYASATAFTLLTYTVGNSSSTYGTLASSGSVTLSGSPAGVTAVVSYYDSGNNLITLSALTAAGTYTEKVTGLSGANAGQYQIASSGNSVGTLIIGKAALTVAANNQTKSYGTAVTFAGTEFTKSGTLYGTDSISSVSLTSTGAGATANASGLPYAITASNAQGSGLSNYNITYFDGGLIVNPKALTVTASNTSKVYGSTLASSGSTGFTTSGLVNSDSVASVNFSSLGAAATASANVYQLNASGATGTGLSNYSINYNPGQLNVTRAPLTVTANDQSKTYGSVYNLGSTAFTTTGTLYNGDTLTGATLTSGAAAATAAAGFQAINVSNATGTGLSNYTVTYVAGRLTVNAAPLTITANDRTKTYGTNLGLGTTGYTVTSGTLFNGDTVTGVTLASTGANAGATVAGGPYAINASNAQGSALYNYTITYVPGSLTVNPAALTVTANNASKTYNGAAFTGGNGVSYSGFVNGQDATVLGGTLSYGGTAQNAKNAGTYSITASGQTSSNYTISYQPGILTVNQAALTVTANSQNKNYGTAITFAGTEFTKTGTLYGSDSIDTVTLTGAGAAATANASGVPYTIVASNAQGTGVGNYAITYVNGSMMVFPKALTIVANNTSKTYGTTMAAAATSGFNVSGLVNSDSVDSVTFSGTGLAGTAAVNVYQLNVGGASGTGLSNYSIIYNPGQLTVTAAPLTITANNQSKTYGSTYNLGNTDISVAGTLYNSDVVTGATLTSGATAATAAAGFQTLYASNATGTGLSNYSITYVAGRLTVNPAPLTITANDASKTYGVNLGLGSTAYTTTGTFYNSDTLTGVTLTSAGANAGASVTGSPYAITASAAQGSGLYNYAITYVNGALTVNKAALTVTANNASKTYNGVAFTGGNGVSYSGFVNGQDATVLGGTLSYGGTAQSAKDAGTYSITASGQTSSNYAISYQPGTLTVNQAALTVKANDQSKSYGTAFNFAGTEFTTTGTLYGSDSISSVTLASAGAAATANAAGVPYTVTASNAQGTGVGNYAITYATGGMMVFPKALTIAADNTSKVYGTTMASTATSGFTASGLVNSDSVTSVNFSSSGLAGTAPVSVYQLNAGGAAGSGLSNYSITYNPGTLIVTPAPLTVTATNQSKTYGTAYNLGSTAFTTTGTFYNGDSISGVTLTSGAAAATAAAGGQTIYVSNATGTGVSNYSITYNNAVLTVNQAPLTITANNVSKTYGTNLALGSAGFAVSGTLYNGDTVTSTTLSSAGAFAGATVAGGPYAVTASGAQGGGLYNYVITYVNGALTVNPAALTVTANNASKTYGQTVSFAGTEFSSVGLKNGESIGSVSLSSAGAGASANVAGSPYAIVASAATGGTFNANNYTVTYVNGALTVNKAPLTVAATDQSKVYGAADPALTYSVSGLVAGDTQAGVFSGALTRVAGENVAGGPYAITQGTLATNSNYTVATFTPGVFTINPASVSVTALLLGSVSKTYDGNTVATLAPSNLGVIGVQTADVGNVLATASSASFDSATAGTNKTVTAFGLTLTGSAASNYVLANTTAQAVIGTIDQRAITVAANAQSKTYDNNAATDPALTYTVGGLGLVSGDSLTGDLTRTAGQNAGSYAIGQGTLANSNYAITYTGANFVIDPRAITVAANAQSKTYDNNAATDPALTYTVGGLGLVSGDSLAGGLTRAAGQNAGSYGIGQGTVANSNYAVTYTGANFVIDPRAITVAANAQSKTYDNNAATDPALTYTVGGLGLVSGDSLAGGLTRAVGQNAGSYAIGQGTVANSNYAITYTGANFVIDPRAITVAANAQSKTFDNNAATDPALTYTVGGLGLVSGDSLAGGLTRAAGQNAGSYGISQGSLANANYAISYTGANFVIDPRAIMVAANAQSKTYDNNAATDPSLTFTVGGLGLVSGDSLAGSLTRAAGQNAGSYAIGQGTVANSNYAITYTGANFVIDPRAITVAANAQSKTYDNNAATDPSLTYTVGGLGLVSGDSLAGSLTRAVGQNAGSYAIGQGTVANSNYAITYTGANFVIDQRAITVAANAQAKTYGDADPALSYGVSAGSLVAGDSLAGTLARSAGENVGNYAINQGTLANANYAITFAGANLSIGQRAITVTADAQSKQAGQADPALTYQVTTGNLIGGDTLAGALSRLAGESVGAYAIRQGTLAASPNYNMSFVGANLQIVEVPVVATNTNGYEPAIYQPRAPGGTLPLVNVNYQFGGNTNAPAIGIVTTSVASNTPAVNQNIAPAGGQSDLFWPISQFDKSQYANATLPDFAAQAGETTVLAMIARAAENNRQAPLIDQLWTNGANWSNPTNRAAGRVTFTDGNGQTRTPGVDSGFPFVNGSTDIATLLQNGPLMLSGAKPTDPAKPASWLLAIKLTDDGKHIVANDPATGSQIVLAYDPATKMVGGVTGQVDKASRVIVPLDAAAPATGIDVPADAWDALKAFSPQSFFAVTM